MVKVWKIAPGEKARLWKECRDQDCITLNWANTKDLSRLTKEVLKKVVGPRSVDQVWSFVHDVQIGDTVVANKGRSIIEGIGVVESPYLPRKDTRNPRKSENGHCHARLVDWLIDERLVFPKFFFHPNQPPTVQLLTRDQCHEIKQAYLQQNRELKDKLDRLFPSPPPPPPKDEMKALLHQFGQVIA